MISNIDQKNFTKSINVWYGISTYWVEICSKIDKRPPRLLDTQEYIDWMYTFAQWKPLNSDDFGTKICHTIQVYSASQRNFFGENLYTNMKKCCENWQGIQHI